MLAQSNSQEARDAMSRIARGESNPELQRKAIQDLGLFGGAAGRQTLEQLYSSSSDVDMKKHILQAFMLSGDRERMFNAAKTEKSPELRAEAIRQLGLMGAQDQIWQLYQGETSVEVKKQILSAMWQSGNIEKVGDLARNEKDHTLRLAAINDLGLMGERSEPVLLSIYASDQDPGSPREGDQCAVPKRRCQGAGGAGAQRIRPKHEKADRLEAFDHGLEGRNRLSDGNPE